MYISDLNTGRGVIIYTSKTLCVTNLELDIQFQESLWCRIKLNKADNLILGCIYRSPNSQEDNNENLFKLIKKVCNMKPSHLLIVGDFNIKEINWVDIISPANETHISTKFIECIRDCFLFQHVMEPTRYRSNNVLSILDLIFPNEENMVLNLKDWVKVITLF